MKPSGAEVVEALRKVLAWADGKHMPEVECMLRGLVVAEPRVAYERTLPLRDRIIAEVVERTGVQRFDILSTVRTGAVCAARGEVYSRLREELGWSYPQIARAMGRREHSQVIAAIRARRVQERRRAEGQPAR